MEQHPDFQIKNGILLRYTGMDLDAVIPDGVTEIGAEAFAGCVTLRRISIPDSVKSIGRNAFGGCLLLRELACSDAFSIRISGEGPEDNLIFHGMKTGKAMRKQLVRRLQSRKDELFTTVAARNDTAAAQRLLACWRRLSLEDLNRFLRLSQDSGSTELSALLLEYKKQHYTPEAEALEETIRQEKELGIRPRTTADWRKIFSFSFRDGEARISGYKGTDSLVVIPDTIGTRPVTVLGCAFHDNKTVTEVILPPGLRTIGSRAFYNCKNLKSVTIPDTVTDIGDMAFAYCDGLEEIHLPTGLKRIGQFSFTYCRSLQDIFIPQGVLSLGYGAFSDCLALKHMKLPDSLELIPPLCFSQCKALREVIPGSKLRKIGSYAFGGCDALGEILLPETLEEIGSSAFSSCETLSRIYIPDGVKQIGGSAFFACKALREVCVSPDTKVGSQAFNLCLGLMDEHKCVIIHGRLFFCFSGDADLRIPEGVLVLDTSSIMRRIVRTIHLPDTLHTIRKSAVSCGNLTDVWIPASVRRIHKEAFDGKTNFTIHAPTRSCAARFAKKYNIPLVEEPTSSF